MIDDMIGMMIEIRRVKGKTYCKKGSIGQECILGEQREMKEKRRQECRI